jgi:mannose/fructose/N-acetylgalactosamine-specific phosphotransferase system component IIB
VNLIDVRVDDRLIHGQVVMSCCPSLGVKRLILANDEAAHDSLQTRLYAAAVPRSIKVEILDLDTCSSLLLKLQESEDEVPTLLVVETPQDALFLLERGVRISALKLGGLHHHPASREIWPGYFLDDAQLGALRELQSKGVSIEVQSIPGAPCVDARPALEIH